MVACKNEAERKQRRQHCLRIWVHQYLNTTSHSLTSKFYEPIGISSSLFLGSVYALEAIGDEFYGSQLIVSLPEQLSLSWVVHMIEEDSVLCPVLWFAQDEPALRQLGCRGWPYRVHTATQGAGYTGLDASLPSLAGCFGQVL